MKKSIIAMVMVCLFAGISYAQDPVDYTNATLYPTQLKMGFTNAERDLIMEHAPNFFRPPLKNETTVEYANNLFRWALLSNVKRIAADKAAAVTSNNFESAKHLNYRNE